MPETGVAGEMITLHGGARSSPRADTVRDHRWDHAMREGQWQTRRRLVDAVSRLKPAAFWDDIDGHRGGEGYRHCGIRPKRSGTRIDDPFGDESRRQSQAYAAT
jgi:hypothetical protein